MSVRLRTILFVIYSLVLLIANASVLSALLELSRYNPTASHLVLVPFVSFGLVIIRRRLIFTSLGSAQFLGFGFIAAGVGLIWVANSLGVSGLDHDQLTASVTGLVLMFIGGFVLCFGGPAARAAIFPLSFLVFVIPIPDLAIDAATQFLKSGSAEAVAGLFAVIGTPFNREGFTFSLPSLQFLIADECSGIRSSIGLLLTSLLVGHIFLRTGWKKALLVAAMFPLAIIKNAIRIVTLVQLAIHVNPEFLTGQLHSEGGIVFYLLTLVIAAPLFNALQRSEYSLIQERHS